MTFRRRTYPEVLDNMLTSLTKGISAEAHPFPPEERDPYRHHLLKPPVDRVVSVYGSQGGLPHLFEPDRDYKVVNNSIEWQERARLPDNGTEVHVSYYPASAVPVITDIQTGSVARTLVETAALEVARLHAQLEAVYQAGFLNTASGSALDKVVALLGIDRVPPGRPTGDVIFSRASGGRGNITIPLGTRIITADGEVEYETTESVTMLDAQNLVRVPARDLEAGEGLPADRLNVLPIPISGIGTVTNPEPTTLANRGEDDAALRKRAQLFLHGSERATLGALNAVLARQGIKAEIEEFTETPGVIRVTPHAESLRPEQHQRLLQALEDTAPAGIVVELAGYPRA